MASPLRAFTIQAPGFFGLNTQDSPADMDPRYALEAVNCVIDKSGRLGARKGWTTVNTTNSDLGTANVTAIGELLGNDGTRTVLTTGNGYLFKLSGSTLTTLTYGGGGVAPTISANNWQILSFNGIAVFMQRGYDPLIYDPAVSATTFRRVSEKSGYTGSIPQANCGVAAYGRIWVADTSSDKNTVSWSDILTTHLWTGGTAGSLNLVSVWPQGADEIVGLAAHNGNLIVFGKRQTLIYSGAEDPQNMALADTLNNVGCIARDSIQNTGEDVLFLSDTGVRSLMRTIQEKSAPLRGLSRNVYNDVQLYIQSETLANVKSVYSPIDAFYLITFPASDVCYCFDTRVPLEDGSSRTTQWTGIAPKSFCFAPVARTLYIGQAGYIGQYTGYDDNGDIYRMAYYSPWLDLGDPVRTSILKKIVMTIGGETDQDLTIKWGYDFVGAQYSDVQSISGGASVSEYNVAEYGVAQYGISEVITGVESQSAGFGKVVQVALETYIDGGQVSIQKIELLAKDGRF